MTYQYINVNEAIIETQNIYALQVQLEFLFFNCKAKFAIPMIKHTASKDIKHVYVRNILNMASQITHIKLFIFKYF